MSNYLIINDKLKISTEVALTPKEHQKGLMFLKRPPVMTFLYPSLDIRKFWMKNTPAKLAIAFIKNNSIIDIVTGIPFNKSTIGPNEKCNKVIEFPFVLAQELNINKETKINIILDKPTFLKYSNIKY